MKRPMKEMLAFLLSIFLLSAVPALAEQNNTLLFDKKLYNQGMDYIQQVAAVSDTLYIVKSSGLYSYHLGDEAPKPLMDFAKTDLAGCALPEDGKAIIPIGTLLGTAESLYSLDLFRGMLWYFDESASTFVMEHSFEPVTEGENQQIFYKGFFMEGDSIYYITTDTTTDNSNLMRLDLGNGKNMLVRSGIQLVAPYSPGILLVGTGSTGRLESLALLDSKTGSLDEKLKLTGDFRKLNYDPASDTAYLWRKGEICASQAFQSPVTAARIPIARPVSDGALLPGGYMAYPYEDSVGIFSTDPKLLTNLPLKIGGQTNELPMEDFSKANPDVTLSIIDIFPESTADLVMHMMGEENAADVYILDLSGYNLDSLYEKGYFADLGDSGIIRSTIDAMYPYIKDELLCDGKIIALPFYTYSKVYAYNRMAFEAVGLSEKDVPKTYSELLDFVKMWGEKYSDQFPSLSLFGYGADPKSCKSFVAQSILEEQMYACRRRGEPVKYETTEMKVLLEKLMSSDFSVINAIAPESTDYDYTTSDGWRMQLFDMWNGASTCANYTEFFSYMPLGIDKDEPPVVLAEIQALLINPYTRNFDTALEFVEFMADSIYGLNRYNLMPGEGEPLRESFMIDTLKWYEDEISKTEKALKEAKDEDKHNIQDRLDSLIGEFKQEKRFEWVTSKDSIASYRALDPYFLLKKPNPIFGMGSNHELKDLFNNRFLDGQISVEQFLMELDQKLRMIELED